MLALLQKKLRNRAGLNVDLVHAEADRTGPVAISSFWPTCGTSLPIVMRSCGKRRMLKAGGRIAIVDWRPDVEREAGPPLDHRIRAVDALEELRLAGFVQTTHANVDRYSWLVQGRTLQ